MIAEKHKLCCFVSSFFPYFSFPFFPFQVVCIVQGTPWVVAWPQ